MKTICIIGAGPSGLFCADKLLKSLDNTALHDFFRIVVIEKGAEPSNRFCPGYDDGICRKCGNCSILSGGGGAGLFSDGKIIQDLGVGGHNGAVFSLANSKKDEYISYVTKTLLKYDGVSKYCEKPSEAVQRDYCEKLSAVNLQVKYYSVLHMGTANLIHILNGFLGDLAQHVQITIKYQTEVTNICISNENYLVYSDSELICKADYLVMGVGKSGASWLNKTLQPLGVAFEETGFYFGLRIEMPQRFLHPLAELSFDPKIYRELEEGRKIKMHCFCRKGKVITTNYEGYTVVGGHSPYTENNVMFGAEEFGNFNVLLSYPKSHDYKSIFEQFKMQSPNKLLVQSLGDFKQNRISDPRINPAYSRVTSYQVANIRKTIDDEFFAEEFLDFITSLSSIFPDVDNDDNLLYGPAFEWCMDTAKVSEHMETSLQNLFAIGDGAGLSQGIMYSAVTGMMAAEQIVERMMKDET